MEGAVWRNAHEPGRRKSTSGLFRFIEKRDIGLIKKESISSPFRGVPEKPNGCKLADKNIRA